jgi:hypothetical protein
VKSASRKLSQVEILYGNLRSRQVSGWVTRWPVLANNSKTGYSCLVKTRNIRGLWLLTAGNICVAVVLLLLMFSLMLALAVLAPYISTWPIFVTLSVGLSLSIATLRYAKHIEARRHRVTSRLLNVCAMAIHIAVMVFFLSMFIGSTSEAYVIPEGYQGDIYVLFDVLDGAPAETGYHKLTYSIPNDGILRTRTSMPRNWTRTTYFFQRRDGSLARITNEWLTTIPETLENLSNNRDVGVYFPRNGETADANGCRVRFYEIYVGTKAHLLKHYKERDLYSSYLRQFPVNCQANPR